jgi:hypothetical protein
MGFKNRQLLVRGVMSVTVLASMTILFQNCGNGFEVLGTRLASNAAADAAAPAPTGFLAPVAPKTFYAGDTLQLQPLPQNSANSNFQWLKDGVEIAGATSPSLSIPGTTEKDAGAYVLQVRDGNQTILSPPIQVTILPAAGPKPPVGVINSSATTIMAGQDLTVVSTATGSPTPLYSWRVSGVLATIIDQKTDTVVLKDVRANAAGPVTYPYTFRVISTLQNELETKEIVKEYTLLAPIPKFTQPLLDASVSSGDVLNLCANAGSGFAYSWSKNGVALNNRTGCLLLYPVEKSDAGSYRVTVTSASGSSYSESVVNVSDAPALKKFEDKIVSESVVSDQDGSFCVTSTSEVQVTQANGTALVSTNLANLKFAWSKDGNLLPAQTGRCLIPDGRYKVADAGRYTVEVSNAVGKTSVSANLIVHPQDQVVITKPLKDAAPTSAEWASRSAPNSATCLGVVGANRYQWFKDGKPVKNELSRCFYGIHDGILAASGTYSITATYQNGPVLVASVESSAYFDLSKVELSQANLKNEGVIAGSPFQLTIFGMNPNLQSVSTFSWYKNGQFLADTGNKASYDIPVTSPADTGRYEVRVKSSGRESLTLYGNLLVLPTTAPPYVLMTYTQVDSNYFTATGAYPLHCVWNVGYNTTYSWKKDGVVDPTKTTFCYPLPSVYSPSLKGVYEVTMTNANGSKTHSFTLP